MKWLCLLLFLTTANSFSQEMQKDSIFMAVDSLYREDQFYFGVTYNQLLTTPNGFSQTGVSTGFNIGFLRDMPINKERTFGFAAGLGLSYNKYHQNLVVSKTNGAYQYTIFTESFDNNKLEQVFIEVPLELRWRTSTPESHKFYRIYGGFKFSYLVFSKTKFFGANTITLFNNPDFNNIQIGPYLSVGWNTWNLHAYYGFNPIFKSATTSSESINMNTLNLGLMFYIL